jgi:1-acyl-sn-glycerol-3-phosphate acyltransferase
MSKPESRGLRPINPTTRKIADMLLWLVFDVYIRTHVSGAEHLPSPGVATLVAVNHTSNLDVFAVGHAIPRRGYFLTKVEATRIPIFGRFLLTVGAIPANRDRHDDQALRQMRAVLHGGGLLGIAPEGTRSADGRIGAFDPGFVWLAARTGALVVPTAIHGADALMPRGAKGIRRGDLWLRFGEPISYAEEGRASRERLAELAEALRQRILGMLAELSAETGVPSPALAAEAATATAGPS